MSGSRWHAYVFEARGIQRFILEGGRLRDVVGASELIEWMSTRLPDDVAEAAGVGEKVRFVRRAGGAVVALAHERQALERFAALWTLAVRQALPGIELQHGLGSGASEAEALAAARERAIASRNRIAPSLPQAGPLAARSGRTGRPAVSWHPKDGLVDEATTRKRLFSGGVDLARRFDPASRREHWPRVLTPEPGDDASAVFPFVGEQRYVGVVHADGNGLGQLIQRLSAEAEARGMSCAELLGGFSEALAAAGRGAAEAATRAVLAPARTADGRYPACPIVLGGEDLAILVRGDLALSFARAFLEAFERESRARLGELADRHGLEDLGQGLTACAGVALVKANHPFHLAFDLAEALCRHAKAWSRRAAGEGAPVPSAVSFVRLATGAGGSLERMLEEALTHADGDGTRLRETMEAYGVGAHAQGLPALDDLAALHGLMARPEMARGAARTILGLVGAAPADARRRYARWRQLMSEHQPEALRGFDGLLARIAGPGPADLPFGAPDPEGVRRSPLGDVHALAAVEAALGPAPAAAEEAADA